MVDKPMLKTKKWFSRFAVALGGFLIFVGIIIIGVFLVDFLGIVDFSLVETESFQNLLIGVLLAVGLIDLVAGIVFWKR